MKAKRLTALALAALMAVSTTSVALAGERVDYDLDVVTSPTVQYYKYDSDAGMLVKVDNDDFQPGDDVYILLEENGPALTGKKTYNAYGTWQIGDSWVKDIDLVYRKGAIPTPSTTTYKTTGFTAEMYKGFNGIVFVPASSSDADVKAAAVAAIKKNAAYTNAVKATMEQYKKTTGWLIDGVYYETAPTIDLTKNGYTAATYYEYGGAKKASIEELGLTKVTETTNGLIKNGATFYSNDKAGTDFLGAEFVEYLKADSIYTSAAFKDAKYGEFYASGDTPIEGYNVDLKSESATIYVNNSATPKKFIYADVAKQLDALNAVTGAKWEKTESYINNYAYTADGILVKITDITKSGWEKDGQFYTTAEAEAAVGSTLNYNKVEITTDAPQYIYNNKVMTEADAQNMVNAVIDSLTVAGNVSKTTTPGTPSAQYEYWIKITTKDSATTKDIDVVGKVSVGTSKSSAEKDQEVSVDFTLTNANTIDPGSYTDREDDVYIEPGERAVVSFADDASDEFTVEFGDDAYFVFNARGQGKLNLAYNTKYNKDFAYDYDDANIDFINFEGEPTTNRTGTLYIYADEDSYIYEVTSKGAKKINGAYYDDDEEAWVIRTRNLTSYAISDKKLKTVDQMNNGSSSSSGSKPGSNSGSGSNNGKPNPDTGR